MEGNLGLGSDCESNPQQKVASFNVQVFHQESIFYCSSFSPGEGGGGLGGPKTPYQHVEVSPEKMLATSQCKNILNILVKLDI